MKFSLTKVINFLSIFTIIYSCNKLEQNTFSGRVINVITKRPIIGAPVALLKQPLFGDDYKVATSKADEQGNYLIVTNESINEIEVLNDEFRGFPFCDKNGKESSTGGYKDIYSDGIHKIDFLDYSPMGMIKFYLKVNSPVVGEDSINIIVYDEIIQKNWSYQHYAPYILSTSGDSLQYICNLRANDSMLIKIVRMKNNILQIEQFHHLVKAFNTDTINLVY